MTVHYQGHGVEVHAGDCLDVLAEMGDATVDSVVTDPPYGLEFMGKDWDAPWKDEARATSAVTVGAESVGGFQDGAGGNAFSRSRVRTDTRRHGGDMLTANTGYQAWCQLWAAECLRVLKPGGHLLAFGGTRTSHRLASAIEDAGFEIRDSIVWLYGSGFPKSLDVGKAIDRVNGDGNRLHKFTAWMRTTGVTARQLDAATGTNMGGHYLTAQSQPAIPTPALWAMIRPLVGDVPGWVDELVDRIEAERAVVAAGYRLDRKQGAVNYGGGTPQGYYDITAPATDAARTWDGWGTALKPAHEPIVVARKPLAGTVAGNVLAHGTGALNIDGCRVGGESTERIRTPGDFGIINDDGWAPTPGTNGSPAGRWPANVVLSHADDCGDTVCAGGCPVATLDKQSGTIPAGDGRNWSTEKTHGTGTGATYFDTKPTGQHYADSGGASRFFYTSKASSAERIHLDGVAHPTVKNLALMRWLVRLVTPPGGVVLDPFAGSGTTAEAALLEGFTCITIEREPDYLPLIVQRINRRRDPVAATRAAPDGPSLFDLLEGA